MNLRSSVVSSQVDLHARFGGVVPEIASRAHLELVGPVIAQALVEAGLELSDLDAVAACSGPGLAGSLLVGVSAAKAVALCAGIPYVGVNHLEAHLYAAFLEEPDLEPPLAVLLVSGGHTMIVAMEDHGRYRVLGQTIDDAAGEAFDKVARHLGLGYPGGPAIDRLAARRRPRRDQLPPADAGRGLRLLVLRPQDVGGHLREAGTPTPTWPTWPPSFQEAVVDVLRHQAAAGAPTRSAPRPSSSAAGWPPTPGCGPGCSTRPRRRAAGLPAPARRCAPTTAP